MLAGACVAASPLLLPPSRTGLRMIVATGAAWLMCQLYDLHVAAHQGSRPGLGTFLRYLPNPAWLVWRKPPPRTTTDTEDWAAVARGALGFAITVPLAWLAFTYEWDGVPFIVEHVVKAMMFCALSMAAGVGPPAALRLIGQPAMTAMDSPPLAHSPADFWRCRWNRPAQQFFEEDVFKPAGGRRAPVRATLITFAVSAVAHEYLFDIAAGRVMGYQMMFFMIQGVAAALTRRARRTPINIAMTFAFNLSTSTLFFASFDAVVPFYVNELPGWLRGLDVSQLWGS
jgi:hypothetical protein